MWATTEVKVALTVFAVSFWAESSVKSLFLKFSQFLGCSSVYYLSVGFLDFEEIVERWNRRFDIAAHPQPQLVQTRVRTTRLLKFETDFRVSGGRLEWNWRIRREESAVAAIVLISDGWGRSAILETWSPSHRIIIDKIEYFAFAFCLPWFLTRWLLLMSVWWYCQLLASEIVIDIVITLILRGS